MPYIYLNATKKEAMETLESYVLPSGTFFEYSEEQQAALIMKVNRLPFLPKTYIQANMLEKNRMIEVVEALVRRSYNVAIEDEHGGIVSPSMLQLEVSRTETSDI